MQKTVNAQDLKIGMYVVLPVSWFKHPFLINEFIIRDQDQIDKIIAYGIREIVIDPEKGLAPGREAAKDSGGPVFTPPTIWAPEKLVPPRLIEAIRDKTLPPQTKAKIVYESSRVLMGRLLEDPKAENIGEAKKGITELVDLILADDETSLQMLKITSYDFYTYTHSVNVGVLSVLLTKHLFRGSDAHDMHELGAGFFLHDIGKVRIDPEIVNKRGRLTDEEMAKMRTHPYQGHLLLKETGHLTDESMLIVMQHHERADGTGYPKGLRDEGLHIYGRICSIADVYDALTADRPYHKRLTTFDALKFMKERLLNHFHQDLFDQFVLLFA